MKVYVWKCIDKLTESYHSEGGLVIFAKTLEEAYEMEPKANGIKPDYEAELGSTAVAQKFVFPDSGCC